MKTAQQATLLSALALIIVVASATAAQAASASNGAALFQIAEVGHVQIAASEDANQDGKVSAKEHKNWVMNNKFTEHVCAAHVFHPKRKHAEAVARRNEQK